MSVWLPLIAGTVAFALTGLARRYAVRSGRLDIPNERSMHQSATPRGGGISFVITFLAVATWQAFQHEIPFSLAMALLPSGAIIATIGWIDDRHTLSNRVRMSLWIPTTVWTVYWLGGLPSLALGPIDLRLGLVGFALSVVGVVWMLNLYNFMDGTDGIAGAEGVMTAGAAGAFLFFTGHQALATLVWVLGAATLGFLPWNWPPAKIFMGDVGSGFLGFNFAVLAIHSENTGTLPLAVWGLLLAVFLVDATFTVIRRVAKGEQWNKAHRSHAYQVQARRSSHRAVLIAIIGVNVCLVAGAYLAWQWPDLTPLVLVAGVVGLGMWWRFASTDPALRTGES